MHNHHFMIQTICRKGINVRKVRRDEPLFAEKHISADATEVNSQGASNGNAGSGSPSSAANPVSQVANSKARIALDQQHLISSQGTKLQAGAGIRVAAESTKASAPCWSTCCHLSAKRCKKRVERNERVHHDQYDMQTL
jgi:hypothetical protein